MNAEFPLVEVSGSAFEMGFQHGRQAEVMIQKYLAWIDKLTGMPRDILQANAMRLLPYIEQVSPNYVEEVHGLAQGAHIPLADAVLCQARAEAAHRFEGGCTAFAVTGEATADGMPLAGQNQDLEPEYSEVTIVLKVSPNDGRPRAIMVTFAGQLGYAGMNEFGVTHFVNALYNFRWQPAAPYYPIRRVLLEQRSVSESVDVMRRHRGCSAISVVMADGSGAIGNVEVRPEGIEVWDDEHRARRLHTNHYLTPEFKKFEDGTLPDSPQRLERIRALVKGKWGLLTVDEMKGILADHDGQPGGICRHLAKGMDSISGYIAEPAKRVFHVRRGHGCKGSWTAYQI